MTWTNVLPADTFIGRGPTTAAVWTGTVGNSWVDMSTDVGVWSINGSTAGSGLIGTTSDASGWQHNRTLIWQGTGGSATGTHIVVQFTYATIGTGSGNVNRLMVVPRWIGTDGNLTTSADYYYFQLTATTLSCNAIINGSATAVYPTGSGSTNPTYTAPSAGDTCQLEVFAYGTSPTTLWAQLKDITTSTTLCTFNTGTDSTSGVQAAGQAGLITYSNGGSAVHTPIITSALIDTGSPPSTAYSCSPTSGSGAVGVASSNFTLTPNLTGPNASTIVTMSDSSGGGTFNPATITFGSGSTTAYTFTYTPASTGTKVISFTSNNATLTNPANVNYVSGTSSMSISPTTTPGRIPFPQITGSGSTSGGIYTGGSTQGVTITVTGVGTSFTSGGFTVTGGFSTTSSGSTTPLSLLSVTNVTATSATLQFDPGPYANGFTVWGPITITDTNSGLTAQLTVTAPVLNKTINVGFIGASITAADVTSTYGTFTNYVAQYLQSQGYTTEWWATAAVDGSSTEQWTPNSTANHNTGSGPSPNDYISYSTYNGSGVNGTAVTPGTQTSTFDGWGNGTYYKRMLAAITSARGGSSTVGPNDWIHIEIDSGDCAGNLATDPRGPQPVSVHTANMQLLINGLLALGYKIILSKQIYTWPYGNAHAGTPPYPWPPQSYAAVYPTQPGYPNNYPDEVYQLYWVSDVQTLVNGTTVFIGDTGAAAYSKANPQTFLTNTGTNPGLHPASNTQYQILAYFVGEAIINAYTLAGGSSGGGGNFWNNGFPA